MVVSADTEHAETAHEGSHFWSAEAEQLCPVDEQVLGDVAGALAQVVPETVVLRLEPCEGLFVGLLSSGVAASGADVDRHSIASGCSGGLNRSSATEDDEVSHRDATRRRSTAHLRVRRAHGGADRDG